MFVSLVMELEARNIAQRYVCYLLCVKLGDSAITTYDKLQQAFGDQQCQEHKPFAGTKYFLKVEPLLMMSSAADDHQQNGQVTLQHR
jgi:hypothetical protein